MMTFSGVAINFAGIPLAFAFLATLGRLGLVTILFKAFGFDIYRAGFDLLSFWGLASTYLYFQIPLMILIIAPAIDGLRKEWSEAAADAWRDATGSSGAMSACRCCGQTCSARCRCCSPTPSAPSPPPMR